MLIQSGGLINGAMAEQIITVDGPKGLGIIPFWQFKIIYETLESFTTNRGWDAAFFHGLFGNQLKEISPCPAGEPCREEDCPEYRSHSRKCPFARVFRTPIIAGEEHRIKMDYKPHPFILDFPQPLPAYLNKKDSLVVGLTLVGRSLNDLPEILHAFEKLGDRGVGDVGHRLRLVAVQTRQPDHTWVTRPIYDKTWLTEYLYPGAKEIPLDRNTSSVPDQIRIDFQRPILIKSKKYAKPNQMFCPPLFPALIQSLLRRLSLLAWFYTGRDLEKEFCFSELILKAESIHSRLERITFGPESGPGKIKLKGYQGTAFYTGELTPFIPWLQLGAIMGVGSKTEYGFGRYQLNLKTQSGPRHEIHCMKPEREGVV